MWFFLTGTSHQYFQLLQINARSILVHVPVKATVLNLLPPSDTDPDRIKAALGADEITIVPSVEVKDRGAKAGLEFIKKVHKDFESTIFAINTLNWTYQSQRTNLYGLACLVPAVKRVVINADGSLVPLNWPGLIFNELPFSYRQKISGSLLLGKTQNLVNQNLKHEYIYHTIGPSDVKKVTYLRTDLWYGVTAGGSVGHVAGVIDGFVGNNVDVEIISWEKPALLNPSAEFTRVKPSSLFINDRELGLMSYNGQLISKIAKRLIDDPPDLVYARYALNSWAPVTIAEMAAVPLVVEYNGSEIWIEKTWGAGLKYPEHASGIEDWVLRTAEVISVVSRPLKDDLVSRGFDECRIIVNPNCVDPARFNPDNWTCEEIEDLKIKLGISPGCTVAGFIGTFSPWHGVEVLANAIPTALNNCSKLHFLLIGDGPLWQDVREKLRVADVLDRVTMTGLVPQDEAAKYLMCSDFFLSPHVPNPDGTPFFGSPTKLFEYMALGKGIIASDLDQLGEVLQHESTALLVKPGDTGSLLDAIGNLYENPDLAGSLGKAARDVALKEYTWKAHVRKIIDHLRDASTCKLTT